VAAIFGRDQRGADGSGSGFVLDAEGHIVTNQHVVDELDPATVEVSVGGRARTRAEVVGSDALTDLAIVRVDGLDVAPLPLRPEAARLGELCVALGAPFGIYRESVALGIVSGVARTLLRYGNRPIERAIQTDAAINPGNSGGPLLDARGAVLGVNVQIDARGVGIGFAIPADTVEFVAPRLIADGEVRRAALGIVVQPRTISLEGAEVTRMGVSRVNDPASPLQPGDVIVAVDGEQIDERADLYQLLTHDQVGRSLDFEVLRGDLLVHIAVVPVAWSGD
jgi:S1-C subfamily serine protease